MREKDRDLRRKQRRKLKMLKLRKKQNIDQKSESKHEQE